VRRRRAAVAALALGLSGCALPGWVPFVGKKTEAPRPRAARAAPVAEAPRRGPAPASSTPPAEAARRVPDEHVTDRVIAVVNNDAITLSELQEAIAVYRYESRDRTKPTDELVHQFLTRMIDNRLQLQEAEREKVVVDDIEVEEDLTDRMKRLKVANREEFEKLLREQGITMDAVKKRIRDSLRVQRLINRKVRLRVSVTEPEIMKYLEANRQKLETGLGYHARHILIVPEGGDSDAAWEAARIKAELLRTQLVQGADFAELARKHSRDASAKDGGDLGTLKRGELAQDIEIQILALQPGEVAKPHRSRLGWHIFKLESKEGLEGEGLDRAKAQIRDILFREKYEARLEAWLKEIKQRAIIEVRLDQP